VRVLEATTEIGLISEEGRSMALKIPEALPKGNALAG
jgi:hypothetical protein